MSADEVKAFWANFLETRIHEQQRSAQVLELGNVKIDADPEYWASMSMWALFDKVKA